MKTCLFLFVALTVSACDQPGQRAAADDAARAPNLAALPSGDIAGGAPPPPASSLANPLAGEASAVAQGKQLFVQMNCAGCHGYDLGGSMGPNLKDRYWRYGGSPAAIYRSIAGGHPQGMPAWSKALPPDQIWQLTAYIQSYGGGSIATDDGGGRQGDLAAKTTSPPGGTGAHSGAKGGSAPAAQTANP